MIFFSKKNSSAQRVLIVFAGMIFFLATGCSKTGTEPGTPAPAPGTPQQVKEITSFTITKADGSSFDATDYSSIISNDSIQVIISPLNDRNNLKASFAFDGRSVSPANGSLQNFSSPVTYTVTANDNSTKQYVVTVDYPKAKSTIFIGAGNNFYALNASTGAMRWSFAGGGSFAYSSPTYKDGVIYVGCIDSYVYALHAITGRMLWKFRAGFTGVESDAVISDSTVYVGCNDDIFYALDAVTGVPRWSYTTGGNISSSPKIANGNVYFGSSDGKLYALKSNTGQFVWSYQTGGMLNQSGACLYNGALYVGSRDANLYVIDAMSGALKWKYNTGTISLESSSPTVNNNIVYFAGWYNIPGATLKGSVYAVNASTGNLVWEGLNNTGFSSSPYVNNGQLFITGDGGKISVLNAANGTIQWEKTILANSSSPVAVNGIVYVGGGGTGYIYALDAITGNEVWKFPIPGALMTSSPLVTTIACELNYSSDSGSLD